MMRSEFNRDVQLKVGSLVKNRITGRLGEAIGFDSDIFMGCICHVKFADGVTIPYTLSELEFATINTKLNEGDTVIVHEEEIDGIPNPVGTVLIANAGFGGEYNPPVLVNFDKIGIRLVDRWLLKLHVREPGAESTVHYTVALGSSHTPNLSDANLVTIECGDSLNDILAFFKPHLADTSKHFWVKMHTTETTRDGGYETTSVTKPIRLVTTTDIVVD